MNLQQVVGLVLIVGLLITILYKHGAPNKNERVTYIIGGIIFISIGIFIGMLAGMAAMDVLLLRRWNFVNLFPICIGYTAVAISLIGMLSRDRRAQ